MSKNRPTLSLNRAPPLPERASGTSENAGAADNRPASVQGNLGSEKEDLVDRIFEFLKDVLPPELSTKEAKEAVRHEFGGERAYIRRSEPADVQAWREDKTQQILALFNGRNASEVARKLGIGRTTVYRLIRRRMP